MKLIKAYKFPVMCGLTWLVFIVLLISNLNNLLVISFNKDEFQLTKKISGTYGKYSFSLYVSDLKSRTFIRSYKTYSVSNIFNDINELNTKTKVWLGVLKEQKDHNNSPFYFIADQELNKLAITGQVISYMISNQILIIMIPLILTLVLSSDEYKKKYMYINRLHKIFVNIAYTATAIFILLIALY